MVTITTSKHVGVLTDVDSALPVVRHFHVCSGAAATGASRNVDVVPDAPAGSLRIQKHHRAVVQYAEAQSMSTAEESHKSDEVDFEGHDAHSS